MKRLEDSKLTNLFIKMKKFGLLLKRLGDSVKRLEDSKLTNLFIFLKEAQRLFGKA